jgi:peptidoglycan/xylan/chitin deacetylase (PgdA/CDA1 family)
LAATAAQRPVWATNCTLSSVHLRPAAADYSGMAPQRVRASLLTAVALLVACFAGASIAAARTAVPPPRVLPPPAVRVPILVYHVIDSPQPGTPNLDLWVEPADFQAQMGWLSQHGYTAVTLEQWWAAWHGGPALPPRPVVISLDDGFRGWYTQAYPVLAQLGWPAVFNVTLNHVGRLQRAPARGLTLAQWQLQPYMIRELVAAGWELDSHTMTHPQLTALAPTDLAAELTQSRAALEAYGAPVDFLCYPYGAYNAAVIAAARQAGYVGATTMRDGIASSTGNPFRLPRITVDRNDGVAGLRAKLRAHGLPVK